MFCFSVIKIVMNCTSKLLQFLQSVKTELSNVLYFVEGFDFLYELSKLQFTMWNQHEVNRYEWHNVLRCMVNLILIFIDAAIEVNMLQTVLRPKFRLSESLSESLRFLT